MTEKVTAGLANHLFLTGDSNDSAGLWTGRILLNDDGCLNWKTYFSEVSKEADYREVDMTILVVPSKEEVFPDLYPAERALLTAIDQVRELAVGSNFLFPLEALTLARDKSFSTIDTHWNDFGATVAAGLYLDKLGLGRYKSHLPQDFESVIKSGDLGGKMIPPRKDVYLSAIYRTPTTPIFSNGITNRGNLTVIQNPKAPLSRKLLIFGDSYSYNLRHILASVFQTVIYVYLSASVDYTILDNEYDADYILCQTNQRFIMKPPTCAPNIWSIAVANKLYGMSDVEKAKIRQLNDNQIKIVEFYCSRTIKYIDNNTFFSKQDIGTV